jgi:hypothetical protein
MLFLRIPVGYTYSGIHVIFEDTGRIYYSIIPVGYTIPSYL